MRTLKHPSSKARPRSRGRGFSLIELMVAVSILAILASIALPKYADLIQKSKEGSTKGSLGSLRGALNLYYTDNQGIFPGCTAGPASTVLSATLVSNYILDIDQVTTGLHPPVNTVYCDSTLTAFNVHDGQGWYYDGNSADAAFGSVYVACDHTDTKGSFWTSY